MENIDNGKYALTLHDISMSFGKKEILKNINLEINEGEVFGMLGPNGAGKSTLFSIMASILKPKLGTIWVKEGLKIGYVPQEIALYQSLSAYDNLQFWANVYGIDNKKERIYTLLDFLNLTEVAHNNVFKFSTGMKRRLNIGVALIHNPDIIIMDEPTVGIDLHSKLLVLEEITKLKEYGKTFIYTTHNPDEPEKICDRIGLLRDGFLEGIGSIDEMKKKFGKNSIEELMS